MFAYNAIIRTTKGGLPLEVEIWQARVDAAGGTLGVDSLDIATALSAALAAASYSSKIKYLLPLLGSNLAAARVPLRDTLNVGIATNVNFVDGDFSEATGLQGDGSSKILELLMKTSALGSGGCAGFGYWENNFTSGGWAIGVYPSGGDNSEIYGINLTTAQSRAWYGDSDLIYASSGNGHWYLNRSSSTNRKIFKDGTLVVTNTTSHAVANINQATNIHAVGMKGGATYYYGAGRMAVAYLTDGTLSDGEAGNLHALLDTYLITPTGR